MKDETVICRCEDITLEELQNLIRNGFTTMDEIKRISRLGMGPCQGRTCRSLAMAEIASQTGKDIKDLELITFRPPGKPVKLGVLAGGDGRD